MFRFVAFFACCLALLCGEAIGHPFLQNSMWVLIEPEQVQVAVNVSVRELGIVQGVDAESALAAADLSSLEAAAARHFEYLAGHLRLEADGVALKARPGKISPPPVIRAVEQTFFQFEFSYAWPGNAPAGILLSQDTLREFAYAPGEAWDVTYALQLKRSDSPEVEQAFLRAGEPVRFRTGLGILTEPAAIGGTGNELRIFGQYLRQGVKHILTGYDHLLFVGALVLATATFWEMVKVIAAFTAAHTVTLALAALNIVRLPAWFIEPVIAASIVFVALENILRPASSQSRLRLGMAFGFGLIHGLGFAGGLLDAMEGWPGISLGLALVAFSLGVEIGHQVVVLPLFGLLRLGQAGREGFRAVAVRYGSVMISLFGLYYLFHAFRAT